jgi:hypothetical protein
VAPENGTDKIGIYYQFISILFAKSGYLLCTIEKYLAAFTRRGIKGVLDWRQALAGREQGLKIAFITVN